MKTRPMLSLLLAISLVPQFVLAETDMESVKRHAEMLADALKKGDPEKCADLTYGKYLEFMGGREVMTSNMKKHLETFKADGTKILSIEYKAPTLIIGTGSDMAAIVPQSSQINVRNEAILTQKGYLIAISSDSGKTWTFMDGAQVSEELYKMVAPASLHALKLPEKTSPTFEPIQKKISDGIDRAAVEYKEFFFSRGNPL